jgi:transcription initiation factor TFIIIB Brf1 subunit/transcription initiation factor TFIIB
MTAMPAPKSNHYAKGNKGGKGGPGKFQSEYIEIAARLCERGLTDEDIAEVLGVSERTIHSWKLRHEEFAAALKRNKELANAIVEASLFKRANGFEHEVEKATASGKKVTIKEYFPPDVAAQRLWLQNRMPEVYREQREIKSVHSVEEGFLSYLQRLDDKAKLERETGQLPQLLEHQVEDAIVVDEPEGD